MIKFNWHDKLEEQTNYERKVVNRFKREDSIAQPKLIGLDQFFELATSQRLMYSKDYDSLIRRKSNLKPCLFISHKKQDYKEALRIAHLANQNGYDIYLDILDPLLQGQKNAILIANLIELALLNSTHLIAVITENTKTSRWVPYEYGRVKDQKIVSNSCSSWVHSQVHVIPEYLYLCPVHHSEHEIVNWLRKENPRVHSTQVRTWSYGSTKSLT